MTISPIVADMMNAALRSAGKRPRGQTAFAGRLRRDEVFASRARPAPELCADGAIGSVNHDLAVLDTDLYGDLVNRLLDWRRIAPAGRKAMGRDG